MTTDVAIIGDRFMSAGVFGEALKEACGPAVTCRKMELNWPDEPLAQRSTEAGMEGIAEFVNAADEVIAHVGAASAMITHLAPLSSSMLDSMPNLKLVAVSRGGPVNVDLEAARARGVTVVHTPSRNASAVAEFTIGAMLSQTRNISRGHDALRQGEFRDDLYRFDQAGGELSEMTVGVIGIGEIGRRVVCLLRAFGCRILAHDPHVRLSPSDEQDGAAMAPLDMLLAESDIVSLHLRLTAETEGMMGEREFSAMKPGSVFVNTARGQLVDTGALHDVLANGHLRGAALDTFAIEPVPPDLPLLKLPNVTLTPHIAGASRKTVRTAAKMAAEEVRRWLRGEPPINPC